MKTLIISLSIIVLGVLLFSCNKNKVIEVEDPDPWILPPNSFFFQITRNGEKLPDSVLTDLKLFYIDRDRRIYEAPNEKLDNREHILLPSYMSSNIHLDEQGVRLAPYINGSGVEYNTWYFEHPTGDIDTLYVESQKISKAEGRQNECYCINPFSVVRFNGKDAYKHSTLKATDGKPVWVLEK